MKALLMTLIAVSFSASAFANGRSFICQNVDASVVLTKNALTLMTKTAGKVQQVLELKNLSADAVLSKNQILNLTDSNDYRGPSYQLKIVDATEFRTVAKVGNSLCDENNHADAGYTTTASQVKAQLILDKQQTTMELSCYETQSWDAGSCYQE